MVNVNTEMWYLVFSNLGSVIISRQSGRVRQGQNTSSLFYKTLYSRNYFPVVIKLECLSLSCFHTMVKFSAKTVDYSNRAPNGTPL
jgi:hypothetical protein